MRCFCISLLLFIYYNANAFKLIPFIPTENRTGIGIIICPGGSYFWLDKKNEGFQVAQWLCDNGISAFVLEYSHAGWASFAFHVRVKGRAFPAGFHDLCRGIIQVRAKAENYKVDPNKIGLMGFSAGGHLVMHAAEQLAGTNKLLLPAPYFIASLYPVVSMTHPCTHKRSRRGLLGERPSKEMMDSLSLEKHVPSNCPPVFLMNCDDDPIVHYHNAELLDSALTANNIPHQYEHYHTGGHGFGVSASKTTKEAIQWKKRFLSWLNELIGKERTW
jgi:acetyl esterase/lipase